MILEDMDTIVIGAGRRSKTGKNPLRKAYVSYGMLKHKDTPIANLFQNKDENLR